MTDWRAWHGQYDDRQSSLARRLEIVRTRLRELLGGAVTVSRVLSLCAGDGRDILPVVAELPAAQRPELTLVELDQALADAAERRAADLGVTVTVLTGDAGAAHTWGHVVPVDLLMLCGIFGNISDADVRTTIEAAPGMVVPGGSVIWTRGHFGDPDLRPQIRRWFTAAGFAEIAFDAEPQGYGIGVARLESAPPTTSVPPRLFSFVR